MTTEINHFEVTQGILREENRKVQGLYRHAWEEILGAVWVAPFTSAAAHLAAERQAALAAKGRPAGPTDLFIASIAKAEGCGAIVTRNVEDFERIALVDVRLHD